MSRGPLALFFCGLLALGTAGCTDKTAAAGQADPAALAAKADAGAGDGGHASTTSTTSAVLGGDAGASLEDVAMPKATGEELDLRMRHLVEALAQSNPDLAGDVLFPRDAFIQTKDSADPQKGWEKKVSTPFRHSVERMHKKMKGIEGAKYVSFELGHSITQITPKKKDWKRPLWRVKHSKLR